jgi:FlgN protein
MSATKPASTTIAPQGVGAELDRLLQAYLGVYDRFRLSLAAHRDAIRAANPRKVEQILIEQQDIISRIAELDGSRRSLIAAAMRDKLVAPGRDAKLTDVAAALPEPQSSRLVQMALELRELVSAVQKEQSSLRLAAGALASHMQGLIQHVARKLSHAGIYSNRGAVEGIVLASALDIRR